MRYEDIIDCLNYANSLSQQYSTCNKTYVGAVLGNENSDGTFTIEAWGCNRNSAYDCKKHGCYRIEKFGSDSKIYRQYCKAIHAEENALKKLQYHRKSATIAIVTRYPCENCARLLVDASIKEVYYGRPFLISEETQKLFNDNGVKVTHIEDWNGDENDSNR